MVKLVGTNSTQGQCEDGGDDFVFFPGGGLVPARDRRATLDADYLFVMGFAPAVVAEVLLNLWGNATFRAGHCFGGYWCGAIRAEGRFSCGHV